MTRQNHISPAFKALDEAIDLAIEERSPYPERASFINAGTPYVDGQIKRAFAKGSAAVLVSPDGSTEILLPDAPARQASWGRSDENPRSFFIVGAHGVTLRG